MKREIRIVGFDDAPFVPRSKGKAIVIGVITRGGSFADGIMKTEVTIDGLDATDELIKIINKSKHKPQLRVIMLNGITIAGFNMVNIYKLSERTELPVIVVNRKKPNLERMRRALMNFNDFEERWNIVKVAGEMRRVEVKGGKFVYYQKRGVDDETAEKIIRMSCTHSLIPEPLRLAHLIASALVKGESGGRA